MIWNFEKAMLLDEVIDKLQEIKKEHGGKLKVAFDSDEESMQYPVINISIGRVLYEEEPVVLLTDEEK